MMFKKIKLVDVASMTQWGSHDDPRFYHYNFPYKSSGDLINWYFSKQKFLSRKVYGLYNEEGYVIGYVTLKHIQWFKGRAELGIAMDPNYCSRGYGLRLLEAFCGYVFAKFPIKTLCLRVAKFNERAYKMYLKAGFVPVKTSIEPFEEQAYKEEILKEYPKDFKMWGGHLCTDFILMEKYKA